MSIISTLPSSQPRPTHAHAHAHAQQRAERPPAEGSPGRRATTSRGSVTGRVLRTQHNREPRRIGARQIGMHSLKEDAGCREQLTRSHFIIDSDPRMDTMQSTTRRTATGTRRPGAVNCSWGTELWVGWSVR